MHLTDPQIKVKFRTGTVLMKCFKTHSQTSTFDMKEKTLSCDGNILCNLEAYSNDSQPSTLNKVMMD